MTRHVTARDVGAHDAVRQSEPFVDGNRVSDAVAGVQNDARRPAGGVQTQNSLEWQVIAFYVIYI